jgi:hypothetical protein
MTGREIAQLNESMEFIRDAFSSIGNRLDRMEGRVDHMDRGIQELRGLHAKDDGEQLGRQAATVAMESARRELRMRRAQLIGMFVAAVTAAGVIAGAILSVLTAFHVI